MTAPAPAGPTAGLEDEVRGLLDGLDARPPADAVAVLTEVHRRLQGALDRVDEG